MVHQLGDARALLTGHARPGVPKVVEVEVFAAGDSPSFAPPEPRLLDIAFGVQDRGPAVEGGFGKVFRVIALGREQQDVRASRYVFIEVGGDSGGAPA